MTQNNDQPQAGIWGGASIEEPKAETSTTASAPQSEISDKNQENKPNCGILEPSGPTTKTIENTAGQPSMTVTEFDLDPMSHKGEPRDMLCAGSFHADNLDKVLETARQLSLRAFPAAPSNITDAIGYAAHARETLLWVRWALGTNPNDTPEEIMGFALSAYNDAKTARKLAFSVFKKRDNVSDPVNGVAPGLATSDGLLVGTSNAPVDLSPDGYVLLNITKPFRDTLVRHLPALEAALVEPECAGGSTLPVEGATALSVEGWGEFCKQLDVLVFACTKTLIEALKATAPHYPEPLGA